MKTTSMPGQEKKTSSPKPKKRTSSKTKRPARRLRITPDEVQALVAGLYSTGCRILHERAPDLDVPMVRAVFERRLAVSFPEASAALCRCREDDA